MRLRMFAAIPVASWARGDLADGAIACKVETGRATWCKRGCIRRPAAAG